VQAQIEPVAEAPFTSLAKLEAVAILAIVSLSSASMFEALYLSFPSTFLLSSYFPSNVYLD